MKDETPQIRNKHGMFIFTGDQINSKFKMYHKLLPPNCKYWKYLQNLMLLIMLGKQQLPITVDESINKYNFSGGKS